MTALIRRALRRLRAVLHRADVERELDEELELHVALEAAELERTQRLSPDDARRRAMVAFGGIERYKEAHRDARGVRWLDEMRQDVRYAARALRRSPTFTLSAVSILALGIGACTAVFSAIDAVVISHLPYPHDEQLVRLYERNSPTNQFGLSVADFQAVEAWQRSFSDVGMVRSTDAPVAAGRVPQQTAVSYVTSGFFRALGAATIVGRGLLPADDSVAAPPVALVTHTFAAKQLGGDRAAVGRTIDIDGTGYTVVGVLDPKLKILSGRTEVWPAMQPRRPSRRGPFGLLVIARMKDGITVADAARDLASVSRKEFALWQSSFQDRDAVLVPISLRRTILGDAPKSLGLFAAAVVLVMLIAVANVSGLMLVRAASRWREVSLRAVLGATRSRIARLLITESVLIALAGAVAGTALGVAGLRMLKAIGPHWQRLDGARMNGHAMVFAVVVALLAGLAIGAYPVIHLSRRGGTGEGVLGGDRAVGGTRRTYLLRAALVVAEFALALPLLAAAGLLLNSFVRLQRVNPGFDAAHVLTMSVALPAPRYSGDTAIRGYWTRALDAVRAVPGVRAAGISDQQPLSADQGLDENNFDLLDRPVPAGTAQPVTPWTLADAGYFAALGVPLLSGRMFAPNDTGTYPVVMVSHAWAQHYFPDGTAVGRKMVAGGCTSCPPSTVIGIVGDVQYAGLADVPEGAYEPLTQGWQRAVFLFVRTRGVPTEVVPAVSAALRSVEPAVTLADAQSMGDRVAASMADPRHAATLVGAFAAAAALLAAIGIFGTLSYTVSMRRREIGVRLALGARRDAVTGMFVLRGMTHAALGTAIGLVAALIATRWLSSTLYQVSATDPATLGAVLAALLLVAFVASWTPARRAAAIDPAEAMRAE